MSFPQGQGPESLFLCVCGGGGGAGRCCVVLGELEGVSVGAKRQKE